MKTFYLILLVLFPSITFASGSSADYVFIVENTSMVNAYWNIFNALAAIFQSESYMDLLKLAFLFGGFLMLTKGVFATYEGSGSAKMISEYGKYLATVVGLLVIISGKSTVWITTNNIPTYCSTSSPTVGQTVDNIPSVLAYSFTVANTIGNGLTEIAESGFTYATESTMTKSDGYLGNLKETIKVLTIDPSKTSVTNDFDFTNMWSVFFSDCVYMPAINQGNEGAKVLSDAYKAKDLLFFSETLMGYTFTQGASASPVGDSTVKYMGETYYCSAFLQTIKDLTNTHLSNFTCTLPLANSGVLELITGNVNTGATGASEMNGIARQAGLITAFKGSKAINAIGIQGADSFTGGTTKASFNMSSLSSASYMADMMPYVQMTLRAVLYAFFPFIFVVIILPGGLKVLAQYAKTLIWIELWTPTAAILHMFVSIHAQDKLSGMYSNSSGITLMNSIDMLSETATLAGVGAMLYVSVPAITWLMITGSGQMLGNVMSGVGASFGSQLKTDQSGIEQAKDLQRQKINNERTHNSHGKDAALSYGEMMFYENLQKAHMDTGTFMAQKDLMDNNHDLSSLKKTEQLSASFEALSRSKEMQQKGITDGKGNINGENFIALANSKGNTEAADAMKNIMKYDGIDGSKRDGSISNKEFEMASQKAIQSGQLDEQKKLESAMQVINSFGGLNNAIKEGSEADSSKSYVDTKTTNKTYDEKNGGVSMDKKSDADSNQSIVKTNTELKTMNAISNPERENAATKKEIKDVTSTNTALKTNAEANKFGVVSGNTQRNDLITEDNLQNTYTNQGLQDASFQSKAKNTSTSLEEIKEDLTPKKFAESSVFGSKQLMSQQDELNKELGKDAPNISGTLKGEQEVFGLGKDQQGRKDAKLIQEDNQNKLMENRQKLQQNAIKEETDKFQQKTNSLMNSLDSGAKISETNRIMADKYKEEVIDKMDDRIKELREDKFSKDENVLKGRAIESLREDFIAKRRDEGTHSLIGTTISGQTLTDKQIQTYEKAINVKNENKESFANLEKDFNSNVSNRLNNIDKNLEKHGLGVVNEKGNFVPNENVDMNNFTLGEFSSVNNSGKNYDGTVITATSNLDNNLGNKLTKEERRKDVNIGDTTTLADDVSSMAIKQGVSTDIVSAGQTFGNITNTINKALVPVALVRRGVGDILENGTEEIVKQTINKTDKIDKRPNYNSPFSPRNKK